MIKNNANQVSSGSETASLSEDEYEQTYISTMLDCSSSVKYSYLSDNNLKRFLYSKELVLFGSQNILGVNCCFATITNQDEQTHLFNLIRSQLFTCLQSSTFNQSTGQFQSNQLNEVRQQTAKFLSLLLQSIKWDGINNLQCCIIQNMASLVQTVGSINQQPRWIDVEEKSTINCTLFHVRLELKTHLLLLLSALSLQVQSCAKEFEIGKCFIKDLLIIAKNVYTKLKKRKIDIRRKDAFMCPCTRQVWVIIIHILKHIQNNFPSIESFWTLVSHYMDDEILMKGDNTHLNSVGELKIWVIVSLAPLHWIDIVGNDTFTPRRVIPGNWLTVQNILQKELPSIEINDVTMKTFLWACDVLSNHWTPNLEIFNQLLDFFNKHLNKQPQQDVSTNNITSYVYKTQDFLCRLERIHASVQSSKRRSTEPGDLTAFDLFLRLICTMVGKLKDMNSEGIFSQLKKRIYSRFHKRRLQELQCHGMWRFTSLFVTCAIAMEDTEILSKMLTLISTRQFSSQIPLKCKKEIVDSLFMALCVCDQMNFNVDQTVECTRQRFNEAVYDLVENFSTRKVRDTNKEQFQESTHLVQIFLKRIEQYFDQTTQCTKSHMSLIHPTYKTLFKYFMNHQQLSATLLNHAIALLSSFVLKEHWKPHITQLFALSHETFYQPLEKITNVTSMFHEKFAEISANLTVLALESDEKTSNELLHTNGFDENRNLQYRCSYISKLMTSSSVVVSVLEKYTANIVSLWISISLRSLNDSVDLTRRILKLPSLVKFIKLNTCESAADVQAAILQFISGVGTRYNEATTVNEMSELRKFFNDCFTNFTKDTELLFTMNIESNPSVCRTAFVIAGLLVKHCAKVIYSKTSRVCLLPSIVDMFILPLQSSKKPIPPAMSKLAAEHLYHFLEGLASLGVKKDDFIVRKLKDITERYFINCGMRKYHKEENPFLFERDSGKSLFANIILRIIPETPHLLKLNPKKISLLPSCSETPTKQSVDYRSFLLGHIVTSHLVFPQKPDKLSTTLNFLLLLLNKTQCPKVLFETMKVLFDKVLTCVLICDAAKSKGEPMVVKNLAVKILKTIRILDTEEKQCFFSEVLKNFIREHFKNYESTILKTLQTVYVTSPNIVKKIFSHIEQMVYEYEQKRGVGEDSTLRDALQDLHSLINAGK